MAPRLELLLHLVLLGDLVVALEAHRLLLHIIRMQKLALSFPILLFQLVLLLFGHSLTRLSHVLQHDGLIELGSSTVLTLLGDLLLKVCLVNLSLQDGVPFVLNAIAQLR